MAHSLMSFSMQLQHKSSSRMSPSCSVPYPIWVLIEKFSCVSQKLNFLPHLLQIISLAIVIISFFLRIKVVFYTQYKSASIHPFNNRLSGESLFPYKPRIANSALVGIFKITIFCTLYTARKNINSLRRMFFK